MSPLVRNLEALQDQVHPRLAFKAHCGPILIHPPQPLFTQFLTYLPPPLHLFESYLSKSGLSTTYSENTSQIQAERGEAVSLRRKGILVIFKEMIQTSLEKPSWTPNLTPIYTKLSHF